MLESPLHENQLLRFTVDIEDIPIFRSEKTVTVSFFDENNKKVLVHKFGLVNREEVYRWIDNGEDIRLNNCYIKDFSLTEYRVEKGYDDHRFVTLKNFSAKKCFFDCDVTTDFSFAEFSGERTVFESAIFANGRNIFVNANFGNGDVTFRKAKFGSGSTSFQSVNFGDGSINFNSTNFGTGDLSFVDGNFGNGNVDFKNTYFGDGNISFRFAKFSSGDITFERAGFGRGRIDFKNVEFGGGKIDFRRVDFNDGDVLFEGVEFGDGKVTFKGAKFGAGMKSFETADFAHGQAQFDLVDFGSGSTSFKRAKVADISFTGSPINCYLDLRFGECHKLDLSRTVIRDIIDVKPVGERVVIKEMNLVDMRILGRVFINWRDNDVYDLIYNQKETTLFQKAEQFRVLKENFRNNGQYDDEDFAYVEFKRCEAKAQREEKRKGGGMNVFLAWTRYYFQKYVFDYIGRYGTNPVRVLTNMVIAFLIFSVIYFIFSVTSLYSLGHVVAGGAETIAFNDPVHSMLQVFGNCMYYSGITFLTIGYGDYFASGILKPVAVFEGFSGVFLMSYFTVAFVRKILR
jgi:hypothetical protein